MPSDEETSTTAQVAWRWAATGMVIESVDDKPMQPMSLMQRLTFLMGGTAVQLPKACRRCKTPTSGNRFTGYRFNCKHG